MNVSSALYILWCSWVHWVCSYLSIFHRIFSEIVTVSQLPLLSWCLSHFSASDVFIYSSNNKIFMCKSMHSIPCMFTWAIILGQNSNSLLSTYVKKGIHDEAQCFVVCLIILWIIYWYDVIDEYATITSTFVKPAFLHCVEVSNWWEFHCLSFVNLDFGHQTTGRSYGGTEEGFWVYNVVYFSFNSWFLMKVNISLKSMIHVLIVGGLILGRNICLTNLFSARLEILCFPVFRIVLFCMNFKKIWWSPALQCCEGFSGKPCYTFFISPLECTFDCGCVFV